MAKLSIDAEFALHEFSVKYREALAKQPTAEKSFGTITDAVRGQYEQEQEAKHSPSVDPSPSPEKEPEPHEPEPE